MIGYKGTGFPEFILLDLFLFLFYKNFYKKNSGNLPLLVPGGSPQVSG